MAVKMERVIVPIENRSRRLQWNGIEVVASDQLMLTNWSIYVPEPLHITSLHKYKHWVHWQLKNAKQKPHILTQHRAEDLTLL